MTIKECIDIVDANKPNQYTIKDKVMWLSFIEGIIINEVLKTHEGYDGRYDTFEGYSEDKISVTLIVPSPYDRLYTAYLTMMIDQKNGEMARYNNSMALYNSYLMEYRKHYHKTHLPLSSSSKIVNMPSNKTNIGLSDAEYEKLKTDLTYTLTEYFSDSVSPDKIDAIVRSYMQTNAAMLKGKDGRDGVDGKDGYTPRKNIDYFDGARGIQGIQGIEGKKGDKGDNGYTPQKGIDYWTIKDKEEIRVYINGLIEILETDVEGLKKQMQEESHFRGYISTNAKIKLLEATPNDFVYSAESGTKWIYDEVEGWKDTGLEVPDQLTPASETTPLIDGTASAGSENAYARGDHRHPTDTTRASAEEFNSLKEEYHSDVPWLITNYDNLAMRVREVEISVQGIEENMSSALDELHNYAQALISGGVS